MEFINVLGDYFSKQIYTRDFPLDPLGSFGVGPNADEEVVALIEQLVELGGLVYIGTSPQDVPVAIRGSRFRLSFILAPIHKLPLRTYREAPLEDVFTGRHDTLQLKLTLDYET